MYPKSKCKINSSFQDVNVNLKVNVPVEKVRQQVQSNREARSMQRRLLTSLGEVESDLLNFNQLKVIKKLLCSIAQDVISHFSRFSTERS